MFIFLHFCIFMIFYVCLSFVLSSWLILRISNGLVFTSFSLLAPGVRTHGARVEGAVRPLQRADNPGTPIAGWFVSWKIPHKWMMTGGYPLFQETSVYIYIYIYHTVLYKLIILKSVYLKWVSMIDMYSEFIYKLRIYKYIYLRTRIYKHILLSQPLLS